MPQFRNKPARPGGEALLAGRPVARVGYGVMQLAERPGRAPLPADEAIAILRGAVEMGVNHFDTAQFYGAGLANDLIRRALAPYADDIVLVSKVGADHVDAPVPLKPAQQPQELRASVEDNLASLGVEQLAVVTLRRRRPSLTRHRALLLAAGVAPPVPARGRRRGAPIPRAAPRIMTPARRMRVRRRVRARGWPGRRARRGTRRREHRLRMRLSHQENV